MEYEINDNMDYDMNTNPIARDIAKELLAVIQNPKHEHAEYVLRRVVNRMLYGVYGELNIRSNEYKLGDFLFRKTEIGQVVRVQKDGYTCYMIEIDYEDLFIRQVPAQDRDKIIKSINYDYSQRISNMPIITINIEG